MRFPKKKKDLEGREIKISHEKKGKEGEKVLPSGGGGRNKRLNRRKSLSTLITK